MEGARLLVSLVVGLADHTFPVSLRVSKRGWSGITLLADQARAPLSAESERGCGVGGSVG